MLILSLRVKVSVTQLPFKILRENFLGFWPFISLILLSVISLLLGKIPSHLFCFPLLLKEVERTPCHRWGDIDVALPSSQKARSIFISLPNVSDAGGWLVCSVLRPLLAFLSWPKHRAIKICNCKRPCSLPLQNSFFSHTF